MADKSFIDSIAFNSEEASQDVMVAHSWDMAQMNAEQEIAAWRAETAEERARQDAEQNAKNAERQKLMSTLPKNPTFANTIPTLEGADSLRRIDPNTGRPEDPNNPAGSPVNGSKSNDGPQGAATSDEYRENDLTLRIPDWGYQDFIAERASFVKGFDSDTGEPGWFYFKIFFRFDTQNGLLGGILPEEYGQGSKPTTTPAQGDCAIRYLKMNVGHYAKAHLNDRIKALDKFVNILSFINCKAPWFFESIGGLDKASSVDFTKPMEDRVLELGFKEDAVDMRVTALLDLYKYACFDYINLKEVIPQNLRQFEMIVVLFHTPLRWYQTGMQTMRRGTHPYKSLNAADMNNRMTYKMYTFKGCEFVHESLGNVYPGEMSNENAFALAKSRIQISYKRCYQHTFNEWSRFMIGDDGEYWDGGNAASTRLMAIADAKSNPYYYNPGADIYKPLVDATEAKINNAMRQILPEVMFGNLYMDYTDPYGKYAKMKLDLLKRGTEPGEMADNMNGALNNQGLFRNIDNAISNANTAFHRFSQGNFF